MNRTLKLYQTVARELAERVVRELDGEVQAVVLYGSVARGQATAKSDIDILIVTPHGDDIRARVVEIEEELDSKNNYRTFLTSTYFTLEEIKQLARAGSPHILDVINEGVVLYDDGSFSRLRQEILTASRGDAKPTSAQSRTPSTAI